MSLPDIFMNRLRPSTRTFLKAARERPGGNMWEALHGLLYLKWPEAYIRVGLGRGHTAKLLREPASWLGRALGLWNDNAGKRFADSYHGKVLPASDMKRLIRVNLPLSVTVPETVLPYSLARDIILDNPADLALLDCPCRASAPNPCLPLDVCIIVGRPIVDFVLEHHPAKSRRVTVEEAVGVVDDSLKRGHVSHAFFKEAVLGRYYAICNCCSCCCGAMQAHRSGVPMLASSGYVPALMEERCIGCGICAKKCPFSAISMNGTENSAARPDISPDQCLGCGVCVAHCPGKALELVLDPVKPKPLIPQARCGSRDTPANGL